MEALAEAWEFQKSFGKVRLNPSGENQAPSFEPFDSRKTHTRIDLGGFRTFDVLSKTEVNVLVSMQMENRHPRKIKTTRPNLLHHVQRCSQSVSNSVPFKIMTPFVKSSYPKCQNLHLKYKECFGS